MRLWRHEWQLLRRSRLALAALLLLAVLSALAVASGTRGIASERQTIERAVALQEADMARQAGQHVARGDAGSAAYYTFFPTWDAPSNLAFLATGLRDAAPQLMRVRALALQAQLHEGEVFNPELALAGRLDFAFVLVYLAPLFVIVLLYDLVSSEARAGRLRMLMSLSGGHGLWLWRAGLRLLLVFMALVLPVLVGAWFNAPQLSMLGGVLFATAAYLVFWGGLSLAVATRPVHSTTQAMVLMSCWALMTLVLPTLANAVLTRTVPVGQGVGLMLAQRQTVHGAWDLPREETMERFFRTHPEWRNTAPLPVGFHWKWYFAFQQLGDESVAQQVQAYREGLLARQRWTERLGWVLPGVGVQAALHGMAGTDLRAQMAYQDAVADFHGRLRHAFYPHLFGDAAFDVNAFGGLPRFEAAPAGNGIRVGQLLSLGGWALMIGLLGVLLVRRVK